MATKQNDLKAFPYIMYLYTFLTTEFPLSILIPVILIIENVVSLREIEFLY